MGKISDFETSNKIVGIALAAIPVGMYVYKKFSAQREPEGPPFPLQTLFAEEEGKLATQRMGRKYLDLEDVLTLRSSFKVAAQVFDHSFLAKRVYEPILDEVLSTPVHLCTIEILLKYDVEAALKIAKKKPLGLARTYALLTIAHSLSTTQPQKALEVYQNLFEEYSRILEASQDRMRGHFKEEMEFLILFLIPKYIEVIDKNKCDEIYEDLIKKSEHILDECHPFGKIKLLPPDTFILSNVSKAFDRFIKKLLDQKLLLKEDPFYQNYLGRFNYILPQVEQAKINLQAFIDDIEADIKDGVCGRTTILVLIKISESLSETDPMKSKELLEFARTIVRKCSDHRGFAILGKKFSAIGRALVSTST